MPLYWGYKLLNFFKRNTLNNGERYDPNILGLFNINDPDQEMRYVMVSTLLSASESVLDIACGTGYGTKILSDKCLSIVGVDVSQDAIKYANRHYRSNSNIDFIKADIFGYNKKADIVVSFETVEHVTGNIHDTIYKLVSLAKNKIITL